MATVFPFVGEDGIDWRSEVSKVYSKITDGFYDEIEIPAEDVIGEYMTCYGNAAELALELEDKLDEIFENCDTVEDCKEALMEYFQW